MLNFTQKSLFDIIDILDKKIKDVVNGNIIEFIVLDPDINSKQYSGYEYTINKQIYFHRPYKTWLDLSNINFCTMLTPKRIDKDFIIIRFEKLNQMSSFHNDNLDNEKYGTNSKFFNINKNEEASFLYYYKLALANISFNKKFRILNIGINKADEFTIIEKMLHKNDIEYVGIDYCKSAINFASNKFKDKKFTFIQADINELGSLNIGKFDLIVSIGTLQSSNINFKLLFNDLVQNYLTKTGSIILGFPNSRWIDGSLIYGAKMKNYSFSDMSLLIKDLHYCKKYLQQKKYKVNISGKDYIFLWANK
jgi:cyclopropane fatty-acyl-phospholipid synthase-like methyltransferase